MTTVALPPRPARLVGATGAVTEPSRRLDKAAYEVVISPEGVLQVTDRNTETNEVVLTFEPGASLAGVQVVVEALAKAYEGGFDYGWEVGFCDCADTHDLTDEQLEAAGTPVGG